METRILKKKLVNCLLVKFKVKLLLNLGTRNKVLSNTKTLRKRLQYGQTILPFLHKKKSKEDNIQE